MSETSTNYYDPVVRENLTRIQTQPNTVSYLSAVTQKEFISILCCRVLAVILDEVREAKYYSIIFDSTLADVAHVDQMSQVLRYVNISGGKVDVKETFIGFIEFGEKNAEALTNQILAKLRDDHFDIQDMRGPGCDNAATTAGVHSDMRGPGCDNAATTAGVHSDMRGQGCDNVATTAGVHSDMRGPGCDNAATTAGVHSDMRGPGCDNAATTAGVHSGAQRSILDINPLATYVPCNNHSLNLAGVHSVLLSINPPMGCIQATRHGKDR